MKSKNICVDLQRTFTREESVSVVVRVPEDATDEEIETLFSDDTTEAFYEAMPDETWESGDSWTDDVSAECSTLDNDEEPSVYCVRNADGKLRIVIADEAVRQLFNSQTEDKKIT